MSICPLAHDITREDVIAWAKNEVKTVLIPFHADRQLDYDKQVFKKYGNANEQTSLKPLEKKVLGEFGCQKFIYCSDTGPGSEDIRAYNHMGERAYIVTQSIKKLKKEEKEWALDTHGFKRVSDDTPIDITRLPADDKGLYYKDEPYMTKKLHQITQEAQYDGSYAVCTDLLNEELSGTLKAMNFVEVQEQGFVPTYELSCILPGTS